MGLKKFHPLIKTIIFFCIFLSVIFFSKNYYDSFQLTKSAVFLFFILILFIFLLLTDKQEFLISPPFIFYFLFFVYIIIRILSSKFYLPSYFTAVLLTPALFIISVFFKPDLKKFLIIINLIIFVSCIYGISQYLAEKIRPFSFFGNPIFFAEFLVILLPFIFISYYFFNKNSLFFTFNIFITLITLILCSSRGPLISFGVSFVILFSIFLLNKLIKFNKTFLYHFIFFLFFLFFIFLIPHFNRAIKYNIERTFDLFSKKSPAIKTRILTAKVAFLMSKENLIFGNGPGAFKYYFPKYQADILKNEKEFDFINTSYVHNDYLQLLSEFGLAGLLLFLFFIFSLFYLYERTFSYMNSRDFIFSTACIASLITILIESFFNFPLFIFPSALIFYLIAGILYSIALNYLSFYYFKIKSYFLSFIFIFLITLTLIIKPFDFISNFYLNYGIKLTMKYLPHDRKYISKAIEFNPYNFFNYFFMGNAFVSIKKYEDAILYYKRCLEIYPYSSDILFNIGVMYRALKDYQNAEEYFKKSIDLYPDFADAHFHLGKVYQSTDKLELANKEFATANQLSPFILEKEFSKSVVFFTETSYEIKYNIIENKKQKGH